MAYDFNSCKTMIEELVSDCNTWAEFVVRTSGFLHACLNDNDISYWEYVDLDKSIHDYWNRFDH